LFLGVTAAGFIAFGFFEIIHARYLHIRRVGCPSRDPHGQPRLIALPQASLRRL
jgi:hypothetical protein